MQKEPTPSMLSKLFESKGFKQEDSGSDNISFYQKDETLFYFVASYPQDDFLNYDHSKITEKVTEAYTRKLQENPRVTKNSSLVILISSKSYIQDEELYNKIYEVEENPFGMRKYVIVAHEDIITWLQEVDLSELRKLILNRGKFEQYQAKGLENDDHQYVGGMQLFIKLPFLNLEETSAVLQTLPDRVNLLLQKNNNRILIEQNIGENGAIFNDREEFQIKAVSLKKTDFDIWLDRCLESTHI